MRASVYKATKCNSVHAYSEVGPTEFSGITHRQMYLGLQPKVPRKTKSISVLELKLFLESSVSFTLRITSTNTKLARNGMVD